VKLGARPVVPLTNGLLWHICSYPIQARFQVVTTPDAAFSSHSLFFSFTAGPYHNALSLTEFLGRMGWIEFANLPGGSTVSETSFFEQVAGARVAIDAFGWLHAAAATDAVRHVCYADYSACINTFRSRIRLMKRVAAVPILCFDGRRMPMKAQTDASRRERRDTARAEALRLFALDNDPKDPTARKALRAACQSAIAIPEELILRLIHDVLRPEGVAYFRGPFEADSQLAYCVSIGLASVVVSADSDVLLHLRDFAQPYTWIRHVDWRASTCTLFTLSRVRPQDGTSEQHRQILAAMLTNPAVLLDLALLKGCDYVEWSGIGFSKGCRILSQLIVEDKVGDVHRMASLILAMQKKDETEAELHATLQAIVRARLALTFPRVYEPRADAVVFWRSPPVDLHAGLSDVCGANYASAEADTDFVLGLIAADGRPLQPTDVKSIYKSGFRHPLALQCWMVPHSRPVLPLEEASVADIKVSRRSRCFLVSMCV
jgi:5'-3' exonuclease